MLNQDVMTLQLQLQLNSCGIGLPKAFNYQECLVISGRKKLCSWQGSYEEEITCLQLLQQTCLQFLLAPLVLTRTVVNEVMAKEQRAP